MINGRSPLCSRSLATFFRYRYRLQRCDSSRRSINGKRRSWTDEREDRRTGGQEAGVQQYNNCLAAAGSVGFSVCGSGFLLVKLIIDGFWLVLPRSETSNK